MFHDKVAGGFDDGGGAAMVASCEKMIALYEKASGVVRDVYFQGGVHVEVKSEKTGETTADGDRAVYEVAKSLVSLVGEPVVVHQKGIVIREEKVVYDLKEKVLFTKPGKKGYNWEFEGSDWMNKPKGK